MIKHSRWAETITKMTVNGAGISVKNNLADLCSLYDFCSPITFVFF